MLFNKTLTNSYSKPVSRILSIYTTKSSLNWDSHNPTQFSTQSAFFFSSAQCTVPEDFHTPPQNGWEFLGRKGGRGGRFWKIKNVKKYMKLDWKFQRGGEVLEKIPSVG